MSFRNFFIPDYLPYLKQGTGQSPDQGGCVIQAASYLWDGVWSDGGDNLGAITCVNDFLRRKAVEVNDALAEVARQQLWLLVPRLYGTTTPVDENALANFWHDWWQNADRDEYGDVYWETQAITALSELIDEYYRLSGDKDAGVPVERWAALAEATNRKEVQVKDGTYSLVSH